MNILVIDIDNLYNIDITKYDKVYLVGYFNDKIEDLIKVANKANKIEAILPSENFDKAYKLINKYIAYFVKESLELLSLFKLCKKELFNIGMVLVAYKQQEILNNNIYISSIYGAYIEELGLCDNAIYINTASTFKFKKLFIFSILKVFIVYTKSLVFAFKSLVFKNIKKNIVLIDYPDERILGSIRDSLNDVILLNHTDFGKSISIIHLIKFFKLQYRYIKDMSKYNIFYNKLHIQANYLLQYFTIISTYNPKVILGTLDASDYADLISIVVKNKNIQYGCYSHGFNYNFRTEYIYIPFDFYFVWSEEHIKQINYGNYIQSNCEFIITGNPNYGTKFFDNVNWEQDNKFDILVIGEYYYNDYSKQPFNSLATRRLARALKKVSKKYKICIRPRFTWDGYYDDMKNILEDTVIYHIPAEVTAASTVMDDILASKIILSVFSGGTHDALLVSKPVIQVNFIGMDDPKDLVSGEFVYGVYNEEELINTLSSFFEGRLNEIDYSRHNKKYINDGIFNLDKVISTINMKAR